MANTRRSLSDLLALLADNLDGAISAQDLRDLLISVMGARRVASTVISLDLTTDHDIVEVDATSGALSINLPAVAVSAHKVYSIKKIDSTATIITIEGYGTEMIDGVSSKAQITQYQCISVYCTGTHWGVLS